MSYDTQDELDSSSEWNHLTFTWTKGIAIDIDEHSSSTVQITYVPFSKTATDPNSNTATYSEGIVTDSNAASYFNELSDSEYIDWVKVELAGDSAINNWLQDKLNT